MRAMDDACDRMFDLAIEFFNIEPTTPLPAFKRC